MAKRNTKDVAEDALAVPAIMGEVLLYQTEDGLSRIEVRLIDETIWLTQKQLSEVHQKDVRTISEHIQSIFVEEELLPVAVIRNFRITATDG